MDIIINKDGLFTPVAAISSYVIRVEYDKDGDSRYNVIKIKEQYKYLVLQYLDSAISILTERLREFLKSYTGDAIICEFPVSFNTTFKDDIQTAVENFAVNYSFSKWVTLTIPDRVTEYEKIAQFIIAKTNCAKK